MKTIYIAGGCFWGVQAYYERLRGVISTRVGYAQGSFNYPTYKDVCTGLTGHTETVEITYDEALISLAKLIEHLFRFIDPTSLNKQGGDIGTQYRTGIYTTSKEDQELVATLLQAYQKDYSKPLVVENQTFKVFWEAEPYHQMYLEVNPQGYCHVNLNLIEKDELKS